MSITPAESRVMEALWTLGPSSAEQVVAHLADSSSWSPTTIKTLLARLREKGVVRIDRDGRRYIYTALKQREEWISEEAGGLLQRLFAGRLPPLLAHFSRVQALSRKDIAEIRALLDQLESAPASSAPITRRTDKKNKRSQP
ncbi:MAG: BlaI/MecI/CopY family transcriptional regulator [Metallibacterium sp.]